MSLKLQLDKVGYMLLFFTKRINYFHYRFLYLEKFFFKLKILQQLFTN